MTKQDKQWRRAIEGMQTFLEKMPGTPQERLIEAYRLLHGAVHADKIEAVYMGFCAFANSLNPDAKTVVLMRVPDGTRFYTADIHGTAKSEDLPDWLTDIPPEAFN